MKVSVNAVWDETLAFIRAERALVVPLALGTVYLAAVFLLAGSLFMPQGLRGLVLIAAGAGGHTGSITGFAFVPAVREFWTGPLVLGGGLSTGAAIDAALTGPADWAA